MQYDTSIDLSIVIPAYNEEYRLPKTLDYILNYLKDKDYSYEIIVIDDGSADKTKEIVKSYANYPDKIKLIKRNRNHGKGYAIKIGVELAKGKYILYKDADGATPFEEIEKLMKALEAGNDIAIASRGLKESNVNDLWYRRITGIAFNLLIKLIVINDFKDTQCGFKLFKGECAREIFKRLILVGFSFDVEVLFLAKKLGYKVAEIPVVWNSIPGSKVSVITDSPSMFLAIVKIRLMDILGKYKI